MMTDAMRPLGLSFWQLTAARPMSEAGGRLFVDVAPLLASPTSRNHYVEALGRSDPLIGDALETILQRGDFVATRTDEDQDFTPIFGAPVLIETDPAIVTGLIGRGQASLATAWRAILTTSGSALLDSITSDIPELKRIIFDHRRPSGDQGRHGRLTVDQRADGGLARREERRRHAHAVGAPQRHVGDGARPP